MEFLFDLIDCTYELLRYFKQRTCKKKKGFSVYSTFQKQPKKMASKVYLFSSVDIGGLFDRQNHFDPIKEHNCHIYDPRSESRTKSEF